MPRADLHPADIMDKFADFIGAINELRPHLLEWERRFSPNQARVPAGQPGGGRWADEGGAGTGGDGGQSTDDAWTDPISTENDRPHVTPVAYRPPDAPLAPENPYRTDISAPPTPRPEGAATRAVITTLPVFPDPRIGIPRGGSINPSDLARPGVPYIEAPTYEQFKGIIGAAMPEHSYDHVVEQKQVPYFTDRPKNDGRVVNNSSNVVELPNDVHTCKSATYSMVNPSTRLTLREELRGQPFMVQYEKGIEVIKDCYNERRPNTQPSTEGVTDSGTTGTPIPFVPLPGGGGGGRGLGVNPKPSMPGVRRIEELLM